MLLSRRFLFPTCVLLLVGGLASASPRSSKQAGPLVDVVPLETTSVWCWRAGPETALLEQNVFKVLDAILDARFDEFALGAMTEAGAPENLVKELRAVRNLIASVAGMVPWRDLLSSDVVYAEARSGMLLACRPDPSRAAELERSITGLLGSAAGLMIIPIRYDVEENRSSGTTIHQLTLRNEQETALLQVAMNNGTILFGTGQQYFETAVALLEGAEIPGLADSPRFSEAFGELPADSAGRSYIDMRLLAGDLDALTAQANAREFNSGFWQSLLNDAVELIDSVETIASTTSCRGDQVVVETLARLDPNSLSTVGAGLAVPASPALLEHVPADAISFDMRGNVDPQPVFRWARNRWQEDWAPAKDLLWAYDIFEAAIGLSFEHDILSWLGSEQVSMVLPSRSSRAPGATDSVMVCKVRDPDGIREVLRRAEGLFHAAVPRLLEQLQAVIEENNLPFVVDLRIIPDQDPQSELRRLKVTALPLQLPTVVYGMVGDRFVFSTSRAALESSLEVAAGREDGLFDRELVAGLLGRTDLCSARMQPAGQAINDATQLIAMAGIWLGSVQGLVEANAPQAVPVLDSIVELLEIVGGVLETIDFLGDSVTTSAAREEGLARYEITTLQLLVPAGSIGQSGTQASPGVAQGSE